MPKIVLKRKMMNCTSTSHHIVESSSIKDVLRHANEETLVIFDIDESLIYNVFDDGQGLRFMPSILLEESKRFFLDVIFSANAEKALPLATKIPKKVALPLLKKYFEKAVQNILISGNYWKNAKSAVRSIPVEKTTAQIVDTLQRSNIPTMAYTARSWSAMELIVSSLQSVGISFTNSRIYDGSLVQQASETSGFGFKDGILTLILKGRGNFPKPENKGRSLMSFFDAIGNPKRVLFVDNCREIVENVVEECSSRKIPVTGIWYREYEKNIRSLTEGEKKQLLDFSQTDNWWQIDHDADEIRRYISSAAKGF